MADSTSRGGHPVPVVRQVALPPAARTLSTLSHIDPIARAMWAAVAPRHRQIVPYLLKQASRSERRG